MLQLLMPRSHLSKLPLARNLPQGEKATLYTGSLCLVMVIIIVINIILVIIIVINFIKCRFIATIHINIGILHSIHHHHQRCTEIP